MNIENYITVYKNVLPNDLCDKVLVELSQAEWGKNNFYNSRTGVLQEPSTAEHKNSDACKTDIDSNSEIVSIFWGVVQRYLIDLNIPYFSSWEGFTTPRHNRYTQGEIMPLHCDHIHGIFDGEKKGIPILSVLASLNDSYEGGELVMFKDTVIPMQKGSVVVFPSCFLYPHKVNPVTKGVRHTCVSWVY
jgi:predicted 2-oxoglutarate/Fe(II)-dependent dioxygenase YbiX